MHEKPCNSIYWIFQVAYDWFWWERNCNVIYLNHSWVYENSSSLRCTENFYNNQKTYESTGKLLRCCVSTLFLISQNSAHCYNNQLEWPWVLLEGTPPLYHHYSPRTTFSRFPLPRNSLSVNICFISGGLFKMHTHTQIAEYW